MTTDTSELPRWDVASIFPSLDSPEYVSARVGWRVSLDDLRELFERHWIGVDATPASTGEAGRALEEIITALSSLEEALGRSSAIAEEHESWLRRCAEHAAHELSAREEDLLAAIEVPGVEACAMLAGELSSTLEGVLRGESRPISVLRGIAAEGDPQTAPGRVRGRTRGVGDDRDPDGGLPERDHWARGRR